MDARKVTEGARRPVRSAARLQGTDPSIRPQSIVAEAGQVNFN